MPMISQSRGAPAGRVSCAPMPAKRPMRWWSCGASRAGRAAAARKRSSKTLRMLIQMAGLRWNKAPVAGSGGVRSVVQMRGSASSRPDLGGARGCHHLEEIHQRLDQRRERVAAPSASLSRGTNRTNGSLSAQALRAASSSVRGAPRQRSPAANHSDQHTRRSAKPNGDSSNTASSAASVPRSSQRSGSRCVDGSGRARRVVGRRQAECERPRSPASRPGARSKRMRFPPAAARRRLERQPFRARRRPRRVAVLLQRASRRRCGKPRNAGAGDHRVVAAPSPRQRCPAYRRPPCCRRVHPRGRWIRVSERCSTRSGPSVVVG